MNIWEKMQKLQEVCDEADLGRATLESVRFLKGDGEPNPDTTYIQGWRIVTIKSRVGMKRHRDPPRVSRWPKAETQEQAIVKCVNDLLVHYRGLCDALAPLEDIDF